MSHNGPLAIGEVEGVLAREPWRTGLGWIYSALRRHARTLHALIVAYALGWTPLGVAVAGGLVLTTELWFAGRLRDREALEIARVLSGGGSPALDRRSARVALRATVALILLLFTSEIVYFAPPPIALIHFATLFLACQGGLAFLQSQTFFYSESSSRVLGRLSVVAGIVAIPLALMTLLARAQDGALFWVVYSKPLGREAIHAEGALVCTLALFVVGATVIIASLRKTRSVVEAAFDARMLTSQALNAALVSP